MNILSKVILHNTKIPSKYNGLEYNRIFIDEMSEIPDEFRRGKRPDH